MVTIANTPHFSTISAEDPPKYGSKMQTKLMADRVTKLKEIEE
jgi:hypothetical protein